MSVYKSTKNFTSFKGLNNILKPENTASDYLKQALNVNVDKKGKINKRKGYSLQENGSFTSLWANPGGDRCFCVKDSDLYSVNIDLTLTLIKSGVGTEKISFEEVGGLIYFTSLFTNGIIEYDNSIRGWGVTLPSSAPFLTSVPGVLAKGTYQVTYTFVDSFGFESGTRATTSILLENNSGIALETPTSLDISIAFVNIYCSVPNGTVLYFIAKVPLNTPYTISSINKSSNPLKTFGRHPAPKGSIVRYFKGRLYVSDGSTLWYSDPYQLDSFFLKESFILLPDDILEIMPVEDGLWIGADNIYFLSGSSPESFNMILKERVRVVKGTSLYFSGAYIRLENTPVGYKWLITTDAGIFVLFNKGLIINLTAENLSLERGSEGTSVFLQDEGMNQYLSILKKKDEKNNSVFGDTVTTSVIRNNINIG